MTVRRWPKKLAVLVFNVSVTLVTVNVLVDDIAARFAGHPGELSFLVLTIGGNLVFFDGHNFLQARETKQESLTWFPFVFLFFTQREEQGGGFKSVEIFEK